MIEPNVKVAALLTALCSACLGADDLGETSAALEENNGENLNGENLNGENLNGENLNGENLNSPNAGVFTIWTSLDNVVLGGAPLDSATLAATVFSGTRAGSNFSGADFSGAQFQAMRGDGRSVTLRIAAAIAPTAPDTKWNYYVDYLEDDGDWYSICHDQNGALPAIPLEGTWNHAMGTPGGGSHTNDPTKFTFACTKVGTLAKCVYNGYEPWNPTLAPYHQACVRMLRADYCGDGRSYTTTGRLVNLYDALGIQVDTNQWGLEAEWTADGARCLTTHRRATVDVPCYDASLAATCGQLDHFQTGTLIMNEIP